MTGLEPITFRTPGGRSIHRRSKGRGFKSRHGLRIFSEYYCSHQYWSSYTEHKDWLGFDLRLLFLVPQLVSIQRVHKAMPYWMWWLSGNVFDLYLVVWIFLLLLQCSKAAVVTLDEACSKSSKCYFTDNMEGSVKVIRAIFFTELYNFFSH